MPVPYYMSLFHPLVKSLDPRRGEGVGEIEFNRMIGSFVETHDHASLHFPLPCQVEDHRQRRETGKIPTGLLRYACNDVFTQ